MAFLSAFSFFNAFIFNPKSGIIPDRYASFCSVNEAAEGKPSVVSDDGPDEKGEAGAPDGGSTGAEAVVKAAG